MQNYYAETNSTCHKCGKEITGIYRETESGIQLETLCPEHGSDIELVESDKVFFHEAYMHKSYSAYNYLILPVTYQCNLSCKFCYAHSNYKHRLPPNRSIDRLVELIRLSNCQTVNLAGGEPTVRNDLPEILTAVKKQTSVKRLCVVTNGQRTADIHYLEVLLKSGMDFLFLPLSIPGYDPNSEVMMKVIKSLENAKQLKIPVWIQASVDQLSQIDRVIEIISKFKKIIFNITIRSVRPYGITKPKDMIFVSDIVKYLGHENNYSFGNHPFNRHIIIFNRKTKISSWVNDRKMVDPYDAKYVIHDDTILPFHKGMILDDLFFKAHRLHC